VKQSDLFGDMSRGGVFAVGGQRVRREGVNPFCPPVNVEIDRGTGRDLSRNVPLSLSARQEGNTDDRGSTSVGGAAGAQRDAPADVAGAGVFPRGISGAHDQGRSGADAAPLALVVRDVRGAVQCDDDARDIPRPSIAAPDLSDPSRAFPTRKARIAAFTAWQASGEWPPPAGLTSAFLSRLLRKDRPQW
jgi:hypothetical protein